MVECNIMFKDDPLSLTKEEFEGDLIQLDLLEFDRVLGMDWLSKQGGKIDCQKPKVIVKSKKGGRMNRLRW